MALSTLFARNGTSSKSILEKAGSAKSKQYPLSNVTLPLKNANSASVYPNVL